MIRRRVNYIGTVQGVGFRATARAIARSHIVSGWVRNEPDGSVMLEVQGERGAVEGFLKEVSDSMGRLIRAVHAADVGEVGGEAGFEIRR
jgi:acylphosphatase